MPLTCCAFAGTTGRDMHDLARPQENASCVPLPFVSLDAGVRRDLSDRAAAHRSGGCAPAAVPTGRLSR
jgi:hypothetical protein